MLLLDTNALVWSHSGDRRLGRRAAAVIEQTLALGDAAVSAMTFWEVAMLHDKGRMQFLSDIPTWRLTLLEDGLNEIPVDGEIAARAGALVGLPGDPADRIIVSTALAGHQLVTADEAILVWKGNLRLMDARE